MLAALQSARTRKLAAEGRLELLHAVLPQFKGEMNSGVTQHWIFARVAFPCITLAGLLPLVERLVVVVQWCIEFLRFRRFFVGGNVLPHSQNHLALTL